MEEDKSNQKESVGQNKEDCDQNTEERDNIQKQIMGEEEYTVEEQEEQEEHKEAKTNLLDMDFMQKIIEGEKQFTGQTPIIVIQNLNSIQNDSGVIVGDHANLQDFTINRNRGRKSAVQNESKASADTFCFVEDHEKLIEFITESYNTFDLAFLVALAVFEGTPYLWVYDIAEELYALMDNSRENISDKVTVANIRRIKRIGGKIYMDTVYNHTGKVETEFICFQKPDYAGKILSCVWKEYIFLREKMVQWLNRYISEKNYSKTVFAINAMSLFAGYDFDFFSREIVKILFSRRDFFADYAVAQIMSQIYQRDVYRENVEKAYVHWAKVGNIHYALTALMMSMEIGWKQDRIEVVVEAYIDELLKNLKTGDQGAYFQALTTFFAIPQRRAVFFKTVVTVLYNKLQIYAGSRYRMDRKMLAVVFFLFLIADDEQSEVDVKNPMGSKDMIFVKMCLVNNEIAIKTRELWKFLWKSREIHRLVKKFLEQYLYQYGGCSERQIAYLRQFLYSFQETESERNDMDYFLKKISLKSGRPNRTAARINYKLDD